MWQRTDIKDVFPNSAFSLMSDFDCAILCLHSSIITDYDGIYCSWLQVFVKKKCFLSRFLGHVSTGQFDGRWQADGIPGLCSW